MELSLKKGSTLSTISLEIVTENKAIATHEYKSNTNILQENKAVEKSITPHEYTSNTDIFNSKEATTKILDIIEKHDNIQEMLEWYNHQKDIINVDLSELKIDSYKFTRRSKNNHCTLIW